MFFVKKKFTHEKCITILVTDYNTFMCKLFVKFYTCTHESILTLIEYSRVTKSSKATEKFKK